LPRLRFSGLYYASKFALEGMSESLRLAARAFGIHVVLVESSDFCTRIAARRYVAETMQNSAHRTLFDKFKCKQDQDEAAAPLPEPLAAWSNEFEAIAARKRATQWDARAAYRGAAQTASSSANL
jgi:short-subunit dehydrogenase